MLSYLKAEKFAEFGREIVGRVGEVQSVEEINRWLGLAMNIWNNTPQPDRGGKSPFEISQEYCDIAKKRLDKTEMPLKKFLM